MTPTCEYSTLHIPKPYTTEQHHIIPVAWQLFWQPAVAPFPGVDPDNRGELWDCRTVGVCPTHHRNTHYWIVKYMHQTQSGVWVEPSTRLPERSWAAQGLLRFTEAGGALTSLIAAHEWGEA